MLNRQVSTFSVAEIVFKVKTNFSFLPLQIDVYSLFAGMPGNISYSFNFQVVKDRFPAFSEEVFHKMGVTRERCVLSDEYFKNPFLTVPEIIQRVKESLPGGEDILIAIGEETMEILNFPKRWAEIYFTPAAAQSIENNLSPTFSSFLAQESATLLHSAGIIRQGRAGVFMARKGGGKSTVVDLAPEGTVLLSEDCVMARYLDRKFHAFATPLGGRTEGPNQAEIGAFFKLKKSGRFLITKISTLEIIGEVWDENYPLWGFLPIKYRLRLFPLYCDMFLNVPIYQMEFPRDFVDWDQIDEILAKQ